MQALGHEVVVRVTHPERQWASALTTAGLRQLHTKIGVVQRILSALWMLRDAKAFDVIFMNRDVVPEPGIRFIEPWLAKRNPRLVFDYDDSIHLGSRERKLRHILPLFAWITPGNAYLAEFARQVHDRVSIWPTVVNTDYYRPCEDRPPGPVRIGWSGSRSTLQYCLPLLRGVICELAETERFEFIVIADVRPALDWPGVNFRYIQWTPSTEVEGLQQIDIGLMPLQDEPFERGKCGLKAIQYMGCGVPALVSPVGVNCEIVRHGEHGYHCVTDKDWVACIKQLLHDEPLRRQMGAAARQRVTERYSVGSLLPKMIEVFETVARQRNV
jgi:glycosyltransferase involved in cell wall biosynthesis